MAELRPFMKWRWWRYCPKCGTISRQTGNVFNYANSNLSRIQFVCTNPACEQRYHVMQRPAEIVTTKQELAIQIGKRENNCCKLEDAP